MNSIVNYNKILNLIKTNAIYTLKVYIFNKYHTKTKTFNNDSGGQNFKSNVFSLFGSSAKEYNSMRYFLNIS